uniref:NADH dehydrogenase subunit 6 n=1 Tax=Sepioteuthis lessoniana TaxID=34570 RepID=Q2ABK0_SEPLE|nr:NADH dehydrogenase subunit 6 [Sepioteuthis lessoniana]BAE80049.1 NADH dehydrogenase subunit 6 [Sepioteuthis lessoniana]
MSLLFLVSMGFSMSSLCMMIIQPLSLGFMLMLMVVCVGGMVSMVVFSWYGYLLFLVYVGGMLVMFMYVISLIPNLIFLSNKVFMYFFFILFGFMMMNYFVMKEMVSEEVKNMSLLDFVSNSMGGSGTIMMYDNFMCYVLLAVILLFVLISVVKICYYCEGPLRVFKFK